MKKTIITILSVLAIAGLVYGHGFFGFHRDPALPPFPPGSGPSADGLLLENDTGWLLLETGDYFLLE
jgi:hypothetical protein